MSVEDKICYQCMRATAYLFPDGRCGECTRFVPEEITGEVVTNSYDTHPGERVRISGDMTECFACGQAWDTNDVCPPVCKEGVE